MSRRGTSIFLVIGMVLLGLWHFPCTQITHGSKLRCNQTATKSGKFKNCIQYIQSEYYVALIFSTLGVKF
jgi:hypothetical protein